MDSYEMRDRTEVFDMSERLRAYPPQWHYGKAECFEELGIKGIRIIRDEERLMNSNALPVEFFNHQLMDVNTSDADSVLRFVSEWGFPFSPYRFNPNVHLEAQGAVEKSHLVGGESLYPTISFQEAQLTIEALQRVSKDLRISLAGEQHGKPQYFPACDFVNAAACSANQIGYGALMQNLPDFERLTSAICNQIIDAIADGASLWRRCACRGCERIFKRKQSKRKASSVSIYCCDACQEKQAKRNQRKAAKNRTKH